MTVTADHPPHVEQHLMHLDEVPTELLANLAADAAHGRDRQAEDDVYDLLDAVPRSAPAATVICPSCGVPVNLTTSECRCSA